jgi:ubiquinone/menaquinone biosynthesis C-methylase UbiE
MKSKIYEKNPFGHDRYGFAFENIPEVGVCLDYGCYDGEFIFKTTEKKKNITFIGIDKNKDIVSQNPYNLDIRLQTNDTLPFEDNSFDCITILDVIEHIYNQDKILSELNRILKNKGTLIITAPKKNIFSFLDLGNYKFIFPSLHKFYYQLQYSKSEYEYRYLNNPSGLIGDVEKEKAWHEHFSENNMHKLLLKNNFNTIKFDGSCLFERVFNIVSLMKLAFIVPNKLKEFDCKVFNSSNLFCKAIKNDNSI